MELAPTRFSGLRGLLALWILFGHLLLHERYRTVYDAGFARHEDFGRLGDLSILHFIAVDLFFMLSGLVLTRRYHDQFTQASTGKDIDRFYLKRLKRIWPLHIAMVAIIGAMAAAGIPHPISSGMEDAIFAHWKWTLALNAVLMNGWGIVPVASWNEPAWTLSVTFLMYVIFPNLLLMAKRLPSRALVYGAGIVALILGYAALREYMPTGSQSDGTGAIARGLCFFGAGVLLGLYSRIADPAPWRKNSFKLIMLFVAMLLVWTYRTQFPLTWLHLAYAPLLLVLLFREAKPNPWVDWLGSRSFALFLTHYPALLLIRHFMGTALAQWSASSDLARAGCYVFTIGLCLIAADLAHRFIEKPFARS